MAMIGNSGFPYPAMSAAFPPRRPPMSGGLDEYLPMTQIAPGASSFGDSFSPVGGMASARSQGFTSGFPPSSGFSTGGFPSSGFPPSIPTGGFPPGYRGNPAMSSAISPVISPWAAGASLSAGGLSGMRAGNPFNAGGGYSPGMASAYRTASAFPVGGYGAGGASPFYSYGRGGPMGGMMGPSRSWGDNYAMGGRYPMDPAQRTGKKVGDLVTALLEENPGLQEKLENINLDALKENLGPAMERYRASVQQAIKPVPRWVDRKVIHLLDSPQAQDLATQFDTWLRKPPSPMVLADLHRQKMQRPYTDNPYGDYGGGGSGGYSDMEEESPQKSWLKRMTSKASKLWPFGKKEESYGSGRMSGLSDADLEALLSSSMDSRRSPYRSRYSEDY